MEVLDDCPLRDPYGEFFIHDTMSQSKEDDILRFQVSLLKDFGNKCRRGSFPL